MKSMVRKINKTLRPKAVRTQTIKKGAQDFAVRFESVMKDLANG